MDQRSSPEGLTELEHIGISKSKIPKEDKAAVL
jgi:hypothetical protein